MFWWGVCNRYTTRSLNSVSPRFAIHSVPNAASTTSSAPSAPWPAHRAPAGRKARRYSVRKPTPTKMFTAAAPTAAYTMGICRHTNTHTAAPTPAPM